MIFKKDCILPKIVSKEPIIDGFASQFVSQTDAIVVTLDND